MSTSRDLSLIMGTRRHWFCCAFSIKLSVFHQIISFSGKISYQELFCMVTLLASSAQWPQRQQKWENKKSNMFDKQNNNSECAAHLLADFFRVITRLMSNLIRMAMQSSQLQFCRKFPFKGSDLKTVYTTHLLPRLVLLLYLPSKNIMSSNLEKVSTPSPP